MNDGLSPADAVAAYVRHAIEEAASAAELARAVAGLLGRSYASNTPQGWLTKGNAPGTVLFAIHRITGVSLDRFAELQERPRSTDERLAQLETAQQRLQAEIEQIRRELGLRAPGHA